ncbi:ABC transporter ATP-binding protein [Brevibacillus composti]|uniref:ABC transporter ATP-binding protein n=1 Tax=Brevibacillus composti TaxID=2796470 RepID=A0A7T5JMQ9_9BACL|nr:ATP-binding cassette domain-containing protein [Brevibacillus composti]QQE73648.1 ABC transporter ATP-binding protein [Brevibacillus composti]QUO40730.1 ABC transporter ATP-binding protein [Brevibacillus composti]
MTRELLQLSGVGKQYGKGSKAHRAVSDVSFSIYAGETFGLIGESGSGKSTLGKMVTGLDYPTEGTILYEGISLWNEKTYKRRKPGEVQIVFQDPQSSLDPRMSVQEIILEPLWALPAEERRQKGSKERLHALISRVGLKPEHLPRYPHEFSGGQRQRIAIARALITDPAFVILDEPTSALDVSVQAHVLNLLKELKRERGLTYLFISHNMSVIRYMCDRMAVMQKGRIVETGTVTDIFEHPQESYTQTLLSSLPSLHNNSYSPSL